MCVSDQSFCQCLQCPIKMLHQKCNLHMAFLVLRSMVTTGWRLSDSFAIYTVFGLTFWFLVLVNNFKNLPVLGYFYSDK